MSSDYYHHHDLEIQAIEMAGVVYIRTGVHRERLRLAQLCTLGYLRAACIQYHRRIPHSATKSGI